MKPTKMYLVGGCVRDEFLGIKSKDIDFSVEAPSYEAMCDAIRARGCDIKVEKPEFATVRAVHPVHGGVDFVLCRKDAKYSDGRRPDSVEAGTLLDDLSRRDFTVNAIARDEDSGEIHDPFGGREDLKWKLLRCVGDTEKRMSEDSLRCLRAVRFHITKGFNFCDELAGFLKRKSTADSLACVSIERIREELLKCFQKDTCYTLLTLQAFPHIRDHVFSRNLVLTPTIKN